MLQAERYESSDDPCGGPHHKRATENTQEDTHGLEEGGCVEDVCVCTAGLVGYNRPETPKKKKREKS